MHGFDFIKGLTVSIFVVKLDLYGQYSYMYLFLSQDKDRKQQSPRKEPDQTAPKINPGYPVLMFPNPYDKAGASERVAVCYPPQSGPAFSFPQSSVVYPYPPQASPHSSASSPATSSRAGPPSDKPDSVHVEIDRLSEASGPLDPPLTPSGPLDPPLQPTVLPLAKVAAVISTLNPAPGNVQSNMQHDKRRRPENNK